MLSRWITTTAAAALLLIGSFVGYRLLVSKIAVGVYRDKLQALSHDYEHLRQQYNQAVKRTAVTELLVRDGKLSVVIRNAQGQLRRIDTPFDPGKEIYVDYVVIDSRLWIRRVFDAGTAPDRGVVIDPKLAEVDFDAANTEVGRAVYRSLSDGRWVVTVTGDGSLSIARADRDAPVELSPPPRVQDYDQVQQQVQAQVDRISLGEVLQQLLP